MILSHTARHQALPASGPKREALRQKGQFWTPDWVAEAMVAYAVGGGQDSIFDPCVGEGAFFRAAKAISVQTRRHIALTGTELHAEALRQAKESGLSDEDLAAVETRDFVLNPPKGPIPAIVANPPYIRHHRLSAQVKEQLRSLAQSLIGAPLDGRAGLHVYFLLRALQLLAHEGRLAFIMPADTAEGVFSSDLWHWVTAHYCLDAVVTFAPEASPFPGVDTNPIVFLISNNRPRSKFLWARCKAPQSLSLRTWVQHGFAAQTDPALEVCSRSVAEALSTGFSRAPMMRKNEGPVLSDFAKVMRGIAAGANDFFFLTRLQADALSLPEKFLLPALGRTRDVQGDEITKATLQAAVDAGRPTLLFAPDGRPIEEFPASVQEYLRQGESMGLPQRALISQRHPWYKMEVRAIPPFLFAYLGRRSARFIRNFGGIVPLTSFLCVYPINKNPEFIERLWRVLRDPETVANLPLVGKSYGAGAIKVEPRALERLPLPLSVVARENLQSAPAGSQLELALQFSVA